MESMTGPGHAEHDQPPVREQDVRIRLTVEVLPAGHPPVTARLTFEAPADRVDMVAAAAGAAVKSAIEATLESTLEMAQVTAQALPQADGSAGSLDVSAPERRDAVTGVAVGVEPKETLDSAGINEQKARQPFAAWVQRNRSRISAAFGIVLAGIAVLVPVIAPAAERGELLIVSVLFGLTGALSLYSAFAPQPAPGLAGSGVTASSTFLVAGAAPVADTRTLHKLSAAEVAREAVLRDARRTSRARAAAGLLMGILFMAAGLVAPFALSGGQADADAPFLVALGFAPVVVSGAIIVVVFSRMLRGAAAGGSAESVQGRQRPQRLASSTSPRRAPVARIPQAGVYRVGLPVAIAVLVTIVALVTIALIAVSVASLAR